ncbi:hypothetical protein Y032_0529g2994 [Ancylostoma ceylanicum]|uniref:Uncharacterized protein n=1 Tax=Ancylostoma ceylanicum TaxID=53326 RepID=A0A016WS92_9BILA|nr:hypothetical protein Y032_0529g2994 [Ancylostoma ceylanicum]
MSLFWDVDRKIQQLEDLVEKLEEERVQIEERNSLHVEKVRRQNAELQECCEQQRLKILELQQASKSADEIRALKGRIAELEEQNNELKKQKKSRASTAKPTGTGADRTFSVEEMEESADKVGWYDFCEMCGLPNGKFAGKKCQPGGGALQAVLAGRHGCSVGRRVLACPIDKIDRLTRQFGSIT